MSLLQMQREIKPEKDQKPNQTGIPSYMKQDFEARSGLSYDDVRIHYSSPKPAELGALAYTQGSHVYIGPGQERHLPHELVHVAQQKRGAVRPTGRLGNVSVNDDPDLERQADEGIVVQRAQAPSGPASQIVQRKIGMEYQTVGGGKNVFVRKEGEDTAVADESYGTLFTVSYTADKEIKVTVDGGDLEYVTPAVDTPQEALEAGCAAAAVHKTLKQGKTPEKVSGGVFDAKHEFVKDSVVATDAGEKVVKNYYTFENLGDTAHPQATVGIRMDKIAALLSDLGGTARRGVVDEDASGTVPLGRTSVDLKKSALATQKQTMLMAPRKAENALKAYFGLEGNENKEGKVKDRASIVGLLSLLFAYNAQFPLIKDRANANAKNAMPVMSRTSLFDAYLTLDRFDRDIFLNVLKNELAIMKNNQGIGDLKRWTESTFGRKDGPKKSKRTEITLVGESSALGSGDWDTVSLEAWIKGLDEGKDAMYHRFHSVGSLANPGEDDPYREQKSKTRDEFHVGRSTDIGLGDKVDGLLVELRGLERGVTDERWGEIASRVAYLVDCLNNGKTPNVLEVPAPGKAQGKRR